MNEELKKMLLDASEEQLLLMLENLIKIGQKMVSDSANPYDDVAFQGLLMFKGELIKLIDKIDGEEG